MSYYHYLAVEILLLIMAIATLKILAGEQKGWKNGIQYIDCGTSGGVYGLERGYCLMVGGSNGAVSVCSSYLQGLTPGLSAAPPPIL